MSEPTTPISTDDDSTLVLGTPMIETEAAPAGTAEHPAVSTSASGEADLPRPRVRWAAIIWGVVFAAIAAVVLAIVIDPAARDAASAWWTTLSVGGLVLTSLLIVGGLLLVAGVAGIARRASRAPRSS